MKWIEGREHDLGGGMVVRRILPVAQQRMVGPFVFLDHMGPLTTKPGQNTDVRPHPHIGLSTLTYLFQGRMVHHDSLGKKVTIQPGEVNWMTAGRGISHSERAHPEDRDQVRHLHGLQFWVALPDGQEDIDPTFEHYSNIPELQKPEGKIRVIAGHAFGLKSPVKAYSPMIFAEVLAAQNMELNLRDTLGFEMAIYVIDGEVQIGEARVGAHQMVVLDPGTLSVAAMAQSHWVLIGGEKFTTPRHIWWNLVSSSREKIEDAKRAWREGTFPKVPGELEFIPLPET